MLSAQRKEPEHSGWAVLEDFSCKKINLEKQRKESTQESTYS